MAGTPQAPTEFDVGRIDIVVSRDQIAPSVPGQPAQGAVTQNSITISWSASTDTGGSGLKGYDVERNGSVIATEVPTTSYVDTGLSSGATYTYRVRARDNAENVSAFSPSRNITTADTTAPTVPVISAAALSQTEIRVSLVTPSTDTGSGLRDYTLQVSSTGTSGWSDLATGLQAGSFPYTHGGLTASTQRFYRLRAFDNVGNASTSAVVNATTQAATDWQDVPSMTFDQGTALSISFAAQAPAGSSSYIIGTAGQTGVVNTAKVSELAARGITLDSANKRLAYDGVGTAGSVSGVILEDVVAQSSDWQSRISGTGVVWYHNFDSAAEVNRFLWSSGYGGGNDPNRSGAGAQYVTHQPSGGADGGGFMRLTYPLGSASGRGGSYWWRPFNAFTGATNGRGANDPGANGAHSPVAWNVTDGGSTVRTWTLNASNPAFFGPAASMAANPTKYYGTDFYVQLRVRRAQTPGPPPDAPPFSYITGKSAWFNITLDTSTANEIVVYGQSAGEDSVGQQPRLRMYEGRNRSGGPGMGGSSETDTISNDDGVGDWRYSGGWDTLLYHITPGTRNGTGSNRTRVEVWAAHPGETSYTKIWDVLYSAAYETSPNTLNSPAYDGWNALILAIYHNGSTFTTEAFNFDYDQVIFSKETIPCPQV